MKKTKPILQKAPVFLFTHVPMVSLMLSLIFLQRSWELQVTGKIHGSKKLKILSQISSAAYAELQKLKLFPSRNNPLKIHSPFIIEKVWRRLISQLPWWVDLLGLEPYRLNKRTSVIRSNSELTFTFWFYCSSSALNLVVGNIRGFLETFPSFSLTQKVSL